MTSWTTPAPYRPRHARPATTGQRLARAAAVLAAVLLAAALVRT